MWKDLTQSQKAEIMDLYLSKGITSLSDMAKFYDSALQNSFDDGGKTYIGGTDQEVVITPSQGFVNPYTGEYTSFTETYTQPIASKDPYVDYQFYSPTGNSIVQTINSTPRWQQYYADKEAARVANAEHQAAPKVLDLLTAVDGVATGPEAIEGLYGLYGLAKNGVKRIATAAKTAPKITAKNASSITPEQWTAAQDAAITRGDMVEAQRLRDLHFETFANPVKTQEGNMRLTHATKNRFNFFDLSKTGSGSGNTSNTEGVIHLSPYDESALDVFHPKSIEERNAYNLMHLYANNPNPIEVPLETFIKSWNDKELFKILRDTGDGIIARGKSPYKLYAERLAEYESKKAAGKLMPWTHKPESPKDFMEEAVVDGYTINNPKNLKSADAVTYDNNGVRIPLGLRDNFGLNDIRYGLIPLGLGLSASKLRRE